MREEQLPPKPNELERTFFTLQSVEYSDIGERLNSLMGLVKFRLLYNSPYFIDSKEKTASILPEAASV